MKFTVLDFLGFFAFIQIFPKQCSPVQVNIRHKICLIVPWESYPIVTSNRLLPTELETAISP